MYKYVCFVHIFCLFVSIDKNNAMGTIGQTSKKNFNFVTNCDILRQTQDKYRKLNVLFKLYILTPSTYCYYL